MLTRRQNTNVAFRRPFRLKGIDHVVPAGNYEVVTDEALIEGLSFPAYRRVATMIFLPVRSGIEMVTIDPADLASALERDAA